MKKNEKESWDLILLPHKKALYTESERRAGGGERGP